MDNKISVVVPVYNNESYIDKLINSIESQTYKKIEVIFVNDGSTDNSLDKLNNIKKKYNNVVVINQKNSGPGIARMNGFKQAKGELLYFIDSDDYLPNDSVFKTINDIFSKYNPDVMFFDREELFTDKRDIINFFDDFNVSDGMHDIDEIPKMELHGGLGCKIFRKSILTEDMFIRTFNFEDFYTTYRYLDKCNNFYYCHQILYSINHLEDNMSLTTKIKIETLKSNANIILELYDVLNKKVLKNSVLETCPNFVIFYKKMILSDHKNKSDKEINYKIKKIIKLIKDNKIKYKPKNKKILKKIYFKLLLLCN